MNKRWLHSTLILGLALGLSASVLHSQTPAPTPAQTMAPAHPKGATTKAAKSRGDANGKDENIKTPRAANDPSFKMEAPPEKGGSKTRGGDVCRLHIDNRTRYYIDIYTDGEYRGQASPFGDLIGWVGCGETKFYGRADFNDGSVQSWGPSSYYVDGSFVWTLHY